MTDDLMQMRGRQDRLEGRVAVLETTVKEEASLRAKMDSDLGEMKATLIAHKHSLQALHDTQSDHTNRLTRIEDKLGNVENRVESLDGKVTNLDGKVEHIQGKVTSLDGKVTNLDGKVTNLDGKVEHIQGKVENIEQGLGDVSASVHAILDLLDTHHARKPRWAGLAGLPRRNRPTRR